MRFVLALLMSCVFFSSLAYGQETLHFAGFAYQGNAADIPSNYPYTLRIAPIRNQGGPSALDQALNARIQGLNPEGYKLVTSLGDLSKGQSLSLAFVLDRETVDVEPICGQYKVVFDIGFQILVFDFETMAVIGSYPLTVEYIDNFDHQPSRAELADVVRQLYLGHLKVNVLDSFASLLSKVFIHLHYGNRIQVTDVSLGEKAMPALPPRFQQHPDAFKTFAAESFSAALASHTGASVLPYTKGYAIGNKMSTRFTDSRVYTLSIPKPDYDIHLIIRGFKKVRFDQRASGEAMVYGSFIHLKVFEPLSGEVYMDRNFKQGATQIIPACQLKANAWPAYQDSLLGLFDQLSAQIETQDRSWAEVHAGGADALDSMARLKKVMDRCE